MADSSAPISSSAASALCKDPADLYAPSARRLIGRSAREYLDRQKLTPTELLHRPELQQRYLNDGTSYQQAVQKAAIAQAPSSGQSVGQRVRALYDVIEKVALETAKRLKDNPPAAIEPAGFVAFVAAARQATLTETTDFTANAALAAHLADAASWQEKLGRLVTLTDAADATVMPLLDNVIAEIVASKVALRDLIGAADNLGQHIGALVALLTDQPSSRTLPDGGQQLRDALLKHDLAETRQSLRRQLRRGLEANMPLAKGPAADLDAHVTLLETLIAAGDAIGGANTIERFGERLPKVLSATNLTTAFQNIPTADGRVIHALQIHRRLGDMPGRLQIRQYVDAIFESERLLQMIAKDPAPLADRLKRLAELFRALTRSGLSGAHLSKYADPIVALQADLIRDGKFFESIEARASTPAGRALALLDLCIDNIFVGPNVKTAQQRVRSHMQHEHFPTTLLAGANDKQEQVERLTTLETKLTRSGFGAFSDAAGSA
jgi:hypothetical protein